MLQSLRSEIAVRQWVKAGVMLSPSVVIIVLALMPQFGERLAFDRGEIGAGQWWRLATGNFVHFTFYHAAMNALGLAAFSILLFASQPLSRWLVSFAVINVGVGAGLLAIDPSLDEYRGMSGVIYGMLASGLILGLGRGAVLNGLVLLGLCAKLIYEQLPGFDPNYMLSKVGAPVATEAHLLGAVTGVLVACGFRLYNLRLANRQGQRLSHESETPTSGPKL